MTVTWAEITAELEGNPGYRQALVAVFRRHEGEATDERDGRGVVYVTETSFARHFGIAQQTFHDWCHPRVLPDIGRTPARESRKVGAQSQYIKDNPPTGKRGPQSTDWIAKRRASSAGSLKRLKQAAAWVAGGFDNDGLVTVAA